MIDGAEDDPVEVRNRADDVSGEGGAVSCERSQPNQVVLKRQVDPEPLTDCCQNPKRRRHNLGPDAVAFEHHEAHGVRRSR